MTKLFDPLQVGRLDLHHRIGLAPLTRCRSDDNHIPISPLVKEYYAQRACIPGTLLISEAVLVSPRAAGYPNIPGIWNDAQIAGWREITDAVHEKGSYIYMQLGGLGRVASPYILQTEFGITDIVSSSALPETKGGGSGGAIPRALEEEEIHNLIKDFEQASKNAIAAGFDGVEIHGANGYLIDQFIQDTCNQRNDGWGGSVEKRSRFVMEIVQAVADAIGADRTAVRFSPWSEFQGMKMDTHSKIKAQFGYLAKRMAEMKLAYVSLVESRIGGDTDVVPVGESESQPESLDFFLEAYGNASPVVVAGAYQGESARQAVDGKYAEYEVIVAVGRPFISNPDLVFRLQQGIALRPYEREVFYLVKDPRGYADYGFSEEFVQLQKKLISE